MKPYYEECIVCGKRGVNYSHYTIYHPSEVARWQLEHILDIQEVANQLAECQGELAKDNSRLRDAERRLNELPLTQGEQRKLDNSAGMYGR